MDAIWAQGRRRLRDLLPAARAKARENGGKITPSTDLGRANAAHVTEDNIEAVLVKPAPLGGWYCDVVFKHVPPGIPNCMGTPVEHPWPTEKQAEDAALPLLAGILMIAEQNKRGAFPDRNPVFLLCDYAFKLHAVLYDKLPGGFDGYGSPDAAADRIEDFLSQHCPEGFTAERFDAFDTRTRGVLMAILHLAALSGLYRYPPRKIGKPGPDSDHAQL